MRAELGERVIGPLLRPRLELHQRVVDRVLDPDVAFGIGPEIVRIAVLQRQIVFGDFAGIGVEHRDLVPEVLADPDHALLIDGHASRRHRDRIRRPLIGLRVVAHDDRRVQ